MDIFKCKCKAKNKPTKMSIRLTAQNTNVIWSKMEK